MRGCLRVERECVCVYVWYERGGGGGAYDGTLTGVPLASASIVVRPKASWFRVGVTNALAPQKTLACSNPRGNGPS
jgi:hypothetical protein